MVTAGSPCLCWGLCVPACFLGSFGGMTDSLFVMACLARSPRPPLFSLSSITTQLLARNPSSLSAILPFDLASISCPAHSTSSFPSFCSLLFFVARMLCASCFLFLSNPSCIIAARLLWLYLAPFSRGVRGDDSLPESAPPLVRAGAKSIHSLPFFHQKSQPMR